MVLSNYPASKGLLWSGNDLLSDLQREKKMTTCGILLFFNPQARHCITIWDTSFVMLLPVNSSSNRLNPKITCRFLHDNIAATAHIKGCIHHQGTHLEYRPAASYKAHALQTRVELVNLAFVYVYYAFNTKMHAKQTLTKLVSHAHECANHMWMGHTRTHWQDCESRSRLY